MIILTTVGRVYDGIADHFPIRRVEWLMLIPTFGMAAALNIQPDMFSASPSFRTVAAWLTESQWGLVVLTCAVLRLAALVVNGTFHHFRLSPHIRLLASLTGMLFWSQWTLGFITSYLTGVGALSAVFAYGTFCAAELTNIYISASDMGGEVQRLARRQKGGDRL